MEITLARIRERLNNRRFTVAGKAHGLSGAGTVFHYDVEEDSIWGTYQGCRIRMGHQVGRVTSPDNTELLYHCLTKDGETPAGWSHGTTGVDHVRMNRTAV